MVLWFGLGWFTHYVTMWVGTYRKGLTLVKVQSFIGYKKNITSITNQSILIVDNKLNINSFGFAETYWVL